MHDGPAQSLSNLTGMFHICAAPVRPTYLSLSISISLHLFFQLCLFAYVVLMSECVTIFMTMLISMLLRAYMTYI